MVYVDWMDFQDEFVRTNLNPRNQSNQRNPGLWALQDLNLRPIDYESIALTN
jgi:hypothetical protein